jgi:hypothetical protein
VTLYAGGYRGLEDRAAVVGRPAGVRVIVAEGFRVARRGRAFRALGTLLVVFTTFVAVFLYLETAGLAAILRARGVTGRPPERILEEWVVFFHRHSAFFVVLLTLFVGSGLVADDLRTRALPLYLSRPIGRWHYYAGKLLVPVRVLALLVLLPALSLVLMAALMRPPGEILGFLAGRARLVGALLVHFAVLSVAYSSVALFVSSLTSRWINAVVLGAVFFLGGEMVRAAVWHLEGPAADVLRAFSLPGDARTLLQHLVGRSPTRTLASLEASLVALGVATALGVFGVLRRARSVEVAS